MSDANRASSDAPPLIVISEGRAIATGKQIAERLDAGADLATTSDPFFLKQGPYALHNLKQELIAERTLSSLQLSDASVSD